MIVDYYCIGNFTILSRMTVLWSLKPLRVCLYSSLCVSARISVIGLYMHALLSLLLLGAACHQTCPIYVQNILPTWQLWAILHPNSWEVCKIRILADNYVTNTTEFWILNCWSLNTSYIVTMFMTLALTLKRSFCIPVHSTAPKFRRCGKFAWTLNTL